MRPVILFDIFLNLGFKMRYVARPTARTSKLIEQERLQIIRKTVFICKIMFNFEWSKILNI